MSDWSDGFMSGTVIALVVVTIMHFVIERLIPINITDAELYRFCMVESIPLEKCKIPHKGQNNQQERTER